MEKQVSASQRGSDRMFEMNMRDTSAMAEAIGGARGDYEVKWWWKYGQPAFIDLIQGGLHVRPDKVGQTLEQLLKLNSPKVQVRASVFPYGIPSPDLFEVAVEMRRVAG